jgi:hypothetical protein
MLMVMVIMTIVTGGLTQVFVAAAKGQTDQDRRFQAQLANRLALDKLRRDVHCANDATPNTPNPWTQAQSSVILKNSACSGGDITWCTVAVSGYTNRWELRRLAGAGTCSTAGIKLADYLTTSAPFTAFAHVTGCGCLASLGISLQVSIKGSTIGAYTLDDTIFLRNSTRI